MYIGPLGYDVNLYPGDLVVEGDITAGGTIGDVTSLSADAAGRAKMAQAFFNAATVADKFAVKSIIGTLLADDTLTAAVLAAALDANAFTEAVIDAAVADGAINGGKLKAATVALTKLAAGAVLNQTLADPGHAAAIPVVGSACFTLTTGAGAETNTMAIPSFLGQVIQINLGTAGGGTRTVTVASAVNQAGNTHLAFTQANDFIELVATNIAGTLAWRVRSNDGVTLS